MAETSTNVIASGSTGDTCQNSGPYQSNRNAKVTVFIKSGQQFPTDSDEATTTWTMVTEP